MSRDSKLLINNNNIIIIIIIIMMMMMVIVMTMTMMMILPKITKLVFDLTMIKFGCSHIENLCLVVFSLDK